MLKRIAIILILITWPISLFLANTPGDFLHYSLPFLDPKFAILPLLFVLIYFKLRKPKLLLLSIIIFLVFLKPFFGQTILVKDYEAKQQNLQKSNLYHSIFLARLFQNKVHIPVDKFTHNFFELTDPNNYFFGFAPRQITVDNQNLKKFPFLSLPFLLIGLYVTGTSYAYFKKLKHWKLISAVLIASIINLSLLTNFDRNDFILWIPLFLVIIHGLNIFDARFRYSKYFYILFVLFSSIEIVRLFIK